MHRAAQLGIARVALELRAAAVMAAGVCLQLTSACTEKRRREEAETPTCYKCSSESPTQGKDKLWLPKPDRVLRTLLLVSHPHFDDQTD